jgi:hypothetical protein
MNAQAQTIQLVVWAFFVRIFANKSEAPPSQRTLRISAEGSRAQKTPARAF